MLKCSSVCTVKGCESIESQSILYFLKVLPFSWEAPDAATCSWKMEKPNIIRKWTQIIKISVSTKKLRSIHKLAEWLHHVQPQICHVTLAKVSKTSSNGMDEGCNLSQCEWTHCCFGLIRRDNRGVNRFPSLGPLKSPLESMVHAPVRLSVYQPASLLPLLQNTG